MLKKIKRTAIFAVIAFAVCILTISLAAADEERLVRKDATDLNEQELRLMAVDFYAVKCGLSKESLSEALMDIQLLQRGCKVKNANGRTQWQRVGEPYWQIHVRSFPSTRGKHRGFHLMRFTRRGELLSWEAHGAEYFEADPDHRSLGKTAVPLPTDATSEDIIALAEKDVSRLYGETNLQALRFDARFVVSEYFNQGNIPVWLVTVYHDDQPKWKGVYGYKGQFMSLVPISQDFESYTTEGEDFFVDIFGEKWWVEAQKANMIAAGEITREQARQWLSEWAPAYKKWAKEHSYAAQHHILTEPMRDFMDHDVLTPRY